MNLAGTWRCVLDRRDAGIGGRWYDAPLENPVDVRLPGSLAVQHIGDPVTMETVWTGTIFNRLSFESPDYAPYREPGNTKFPFWLQPESQYLGAAWFQREIAVPERWAGKRLELTLERVHWSTRVWLDEREVGAGDSLSTPHRFDLGRRVPVGTHRLTIRVDNRLRVAVGENAHSVSDHTQGNWNGVIGRMELSARGTAWFNDLQVSPNFATRSVHISGTVGGATGCMVNLKVPLAGIATISFVADGVFATEYPLGPDAPLWSEFEPCLHTLTATLFDGGSQVDERSVRFGLREIATEGAEFRLNGRPVFLRGTLECCVFPLTGHPPMDVESWRRALRTVQAHGLNHVRFHSWCPPEAAFVAGDELGVYFQIEAATWPNAVAVEAGLSPAGLGDGNAVDDWVYAETARILREYGHHPCFILMAAGNEPGGPGHASYLAAWVAHFRHLDPHRLYTGAAGWPELEENQFHIIPEPRVHQWGDGLGCRFNGQPPATVADYRASVVKRRVPVISHEIGQWCSYPPLGDAVKFTGHLKARNYEIFADTLAASSLGEQIDAFVQASGKLQALCYKEEIETALRTPDMGGFQLLDLRDFPGQGTAPVGVLNVFWESKGYITAKEFRRFCAPTVLLARLPKRVFTSEETFRAAIEVAHFGPAPMEQAVVSWRVVNLSDGDAAVGDGVLRPMRIPFGTARGLGDVSLGLASVPAPAHCRLIVWIEQTSVANDWDFWVYPGGAEDVLPDGMVVLRAWDAGAEEILAGGGKVLLVLPRPVQHSASIELGFTPIFWNTWCTKRQAPHTLGVLCDPAHPALAGFPTDCHTDWQWWPLLRHASAMILDGLPPGLRPIIQVIDDWYTNRRLGLLFEARVGPGRLLVSGIDFMDAGPDGPVLRQFRHSVLAYMKGSLFRPDTKLTAAELRAALPCNE